MSSFIKKKHFFSQKNPNFVRIWEILLLQSHSIIFYDLVIKKIEIQNRTFGVGHF